MAADGLAGSLLCQARPADLAPLARRRTVSRFVIRKPNRDRGDFTLDSYFTNAENLNHIHAKKDKFDRPRGYVGDLKFNRKIQFKGKELKAEEFAASIPSGSRKELRSLRIARQAWPRSPPAR